MGIFSKVAVKETKQQTEVEQPTQKEEVQQPKKKNQQELI